MSIPPSPSPVSFGILTPPKNKHKFLPEKLFSSDLALQIQKDAAHFNRQSKSNVKQGKTNAEWETSMNKASERSDESDRIQTNMAEQFKQLNMRYPVEKKERKTS